MKTARSGAGTTSRPSHDRSEPQFFQLLDQPWGSFSDHEAVHGLEARIVTRSGDGSGATFMARLPAGFRRTLKALDATVEWFVLEGDLTLAGRSVRGGGFLALPKACGPARLSSAGGAVVYCFVTPDLRLPTYNAGIHSTNLWQQEWIPASLVGMRHGVMSKSVRVPDVRGTQAVGGASGLLRMTLMTPGFAEPRQEVHHNCWEEVIVLAGDMLFGDRGRLAPGSVMSNPPRMWHAPMASQRGCVFFLHSDAPMDVDYRPWKGGFEACCDHMETHSWLDEIQHEAIDAPPHEYLRVGAGD